jgi:hypothetical protein
MIRTILFVGGLAALTTPALAGEIKVRLTGHTAAEMQADIRRAATIECREALRGSVASFSQLDTCVRSVSQDIEAQLAPVMAQRMATAVATR